MKDHVHARTLAARAVSVRQRLRRSIVSTGALPCAPARLVRLVTAAGKDQLRRRPARHCLTARWCQLDDRILTRGLELNPTVAQRPKCTV